MNKLFLKALNKLNLLEIVNVTVPIQLNKKNFLIPVEGKTGYSNVFTTEPWMVGLLEKILLLKSGIFVDVGVNIGQTLLKLRCVDKEISYVGFEPNPFCINYTSKLIALNEFENSILMPFGVSNKTEVGVLNFFYSGNTDSTASIIPEFRPEQKIERKVFIPLYDFTKFNHFLKSDSVGFLKIDVEGAELEVLESFTEVINQSNPYILIEILPIYNKENETRLERQNKIELLLKDCDYSILRIIKEGNSVAKLEEVKTFGIHSNLDHCDYICVPKSVLNKILELTF